VVIAPARGRRPGAVSGATLEEDDPSTCPFCPGHERETPPETFAIGPPERGPDAPGWLVRVFPNKFPAFVDPAPPPQAHGGSACFAVRAAIGRHEVVSHSPEHVASFGDLGPTDVERVATAWSNRAAAARSAGYTYVHALLNEGRAAGASRSHSHSQLVWLPEMPEAVLEEQAKEGCPLCLLVAGERAAGERVVADAGDLVLLCPYASRSPYELLVAPADCESDAFASALLPAALALLRTAIQRLHAAAGRVPLNAWLHTASFGEPAGHWHLEILPRLTVAAGIELGAGISINPLAPETAAAELRVS
jgi:UDPglucose--hexose-1-phosphate uridylyltransferase